MSEWTLTTSSFSDGRESKDREFGEHGGKQFDQRQQSHSGIVGINSKSMQPSWNSERVAGNRRVGRDRSNLNLL